MEVHRKECPFEMIQCEYCSVGCKVMMARKDQEKHENDEMKEHLMKTKLAMTDMKCELNNTKFELNKAKIDLNATTNDLIDTKATLVNIKATLANTESQLTDTNNQLASTLKRISSLEVLLYLATDKVIAKPTSGAVVLESSVRWPDKLAVMAMMSKSSNQKCPVILRMSQFNKQKKNNVEWYSDSFTTKDTRCV